MKPPRKLRDPGGAQRRFVSAPTRPDAADLRADNPAVLEGRTIFPTRVFGPWASPRLLIEGKNSPKTGDRVTKGPWAGFPIYTLTLEERATCPRSCALWRGCYGSGMPYARRNDAADPDFIAALAAEVITTARLHPGGFVVRLHILGDFYSAAYVRVWVRLLFLCPNLRVFGYTARRSDLDDRESQKIALALQVVTEALWDRFAIRTSHTEPGRDRVIVVKQDPGLEDVIVCPAQTGQTTCCAECGLCWAGAARGKTIAFLRHGNHAPAGGD